MVLYAPYVFARNWMLLTVFIIAYMLWVPQMSVWKFDQHTNCLGNLPLWWVFTYISSLHLWKLFFTHCVFSLVAGKALVWVMELVVLCPIPLVAQWPFQWASIHTETETAEWEAAIANLNCTYASPALRSQKVSCKKGLFHYCTDLAPFLLTRLGTNSIKGMWKPFKKKEKEKKKHLLVFNWKNLK